MEKWRCSICEYIYDPKKGDPETGINPGTSFQDLPDYWGCPDCGASKQNFELYIEDGIGY
ncbi:MAG: rubredoxin [bacterium]